VDTAIAPPRKRFFIAIAEKTGKLRGYVAEMNVR
jgi:hypothetical protein